jgi:serine phosphatase RsbU (regulator of sigma subunit)
LRSWDFFCWKSSCYGIFLKPVGFIFYNKETMQSDYLPEMELLERFRSTPKNGMVSVYQDVRNFILWETNQAQTNFRPEISDDVAIRTYLLECYIQGATQGKLTRIRSSLEQFYTWLTINGLIAENPFDISNLDWTTFIRSQTRPRHESFTGTTGQREIARLRGLNRLAESTNQASDVQSMLNGTLKTLLEVMNLNTGWISLKYDSGIINQTTGQPPVHGFVLSAAQNLPPSLEQSGRYYLTRPPECHCQNLLNKGRLKRGVNVVECSRLQDAARTSKENNSLMFHASVPVFNNNQPIGIINIAAKDWQLLSASDLQFLTAGARQVGTALERAHLYDQVRIQHTHLKHELEMARKVQISLLPERLPTIRGYDLAALWKPAYETSGDYYNIFKLPGGRWGFIVADVCDKGAPAALYMAMAHGIFRDRVAKGTSPATFLTGVNQALYGLGIKTNFITSFYAILDPVGSGLSYALAGHPPPLLRTPSGDVKTLPGKGVALGIFPDAQYLDMEISLAHGESLVAFTDGLTDAINPMRESFQMTNLQTAIATAPAQSKALIKHLQKSLGDWIKEAPNYDDITLLVIGRK